MKNRLIRSETYERLADSEGNPRLELGDLYAELIRGGIGAIITGFAFVSRSGRSMQPFQCGIETDARIRPWASVLRRARSGRCGVPIVLQIAHAGRQTQSSVTGTRAVGASLRRCTYFRQKVHVLEDTEVERISDEFGLAALRAAEAGFDGVQIHGAHGYLVHQFLSPWTNTRRDRWKDRPLFLEEIVKSIRKRCGPRFPILVKLSASETRSPGIMIEDTVKTVRRLEDLQVSAVEISYGSMEYALNIIRGACPLDTIFTVNPLFNRIPRLLRPIWRKYLSVKIAEFIPFTQGYNVAAAARIRRETRLPVMCVGGFRSAEGMARALSDSHLDALGLCRPLICEPDFPARILNGRVARSACNNCNLCAVHCDSPEPVRCIRS